MRQHQVGKAGKDLEQRTHQKMYQYLSLIAWKAAWLPGAPVTMWIVDVRRLLFSSAQ